MKAEQPLGQACGIVEVTGIYEHCRDDQPLTLQDACHMIFLDAITPSTLMAEAQRGNLCMEKIGRRYFVTPAGIEEMRKKCRVVPTEKARASGYNHSAATPMAASSGHDGLSVMDRSNAAQGALQMTLKALKKPSPNTLRKNTSHGGTPATHRGL